MMLGAVMSQRTATTLTLSGSGNDGYLYGGTAATYNNNSPAVYIGSVGRSWWRFIAGIPKRKRILSAVLTLQARLTEAGAASAVMGAYAADNPAAPTDGPSGRVQVYDTGGAANNQTVASVTWDWSDTTANTSYASPDLKAIIQEIVNRSGWASGNAMIVWSRPGSGEKDLKSVDAGFAATLAIVYAP